MAVLAVGLAACSSALPQETLTAEMLYTQGAQTVIAAVTQGAQGTPAAPTNPPAGQATQPGATPPPNILPTVPPTLTTRPTDASTATPPPTLTTAPQAAAPTDPALTLVLEDDFSNPDLWANEQNDDFGFFVEDGVFHMYANLLNAGIWSIRGRERADVRVEVDGLLDQGPDNGFYGVVCRLVDEDNYYALMITSGGEYLIGKMLDGEFVELARAAAGAGYINPGEAANRVRGDCFGSTLRVWANGHLLAEVQDSDFEAGQTGLSIRTRMEGGLEVVFDNYKIWVP